MLAFLFHLGIAMMTIPMLALFSLPISYSVGRRIASPAVSPQQFYSDHLLLLVFIAGLCVAYLVCDTFTSRSARWIWIPALLAFTVRVLVWRSTGSVLFRSSVIEHFFTSDCQINYWRNTNFAPDCADKLLFMQLIIGPIGYSVGAAIQRIVEVRRRANTVAS